MPLLLADFPEQGGNAEQVHHHAQPQKRACASPEQGIISLLAR